MRAFTLLLLNVLIVSSCVFSILAQPQPAWVFDNNVNPDGMTLEAGNPFLGVAANVPYIIGTVQDVNSGNTTICLFDAVVNGTCTDIILQLSGLDYRAEVIKRANYYDSFVITVHNTVSGHVTSYRWNAHVGIEWYKERGILEPRNTQLFELSDNLDFLVTASPVGIADIIVGSFTTDHKRHEFATAILPIPEKYQKPNRAYARDLFYLVGGASPAFAAISLGRVFAIDATSGLTITEVDNPCGFNSTEFHMTNLRVADRGFAIIVYGNALSQGASGEDVFVVCALAMNSSLTYLWHTTTPFYITPANGDDSVITIRTSYDNALVPFAVDFLFISGQKGNDDTVNYLWAFSIQNQSLSWEFSRLVSDQYNMPVFIDGPEDEHIAFTVNDLLIGYDPVNQNQKWACTGQHIGCAGTPAVRRSPTTGAIGRAVCASTIRENQVVAVDFGLNQQCQLAWRQTLPEPVAVKEQNKPSVANSVVYPLEPFAIVLTTDGTVWTLPFRSTSDPAPPPYTTPAPTPAPTFPPGVYPQPKYYAVTPPLSKFDLVSIAAAPAFAPFSTDGPVIAAVALVTTSAEGMTKIRADEHLARSHDSNNNGNDDYDNDDEIGLGTSFTAFFYQSIPLGSFKSFDYSYTLLPTFYQLTRPINVYFGAAQYAVASIEELGDDDILLLYTLPGKRGGWLDRLGRYGCESGIASNGNGILVYGSGVISNKEYIWARLQRGQGNATTIEWYRELSPANGTTFDNLTFHTGDVAYGSRHGKDFYAYSYFNQLYIVNGADGTDAIPPITNPGGFQPSANEFTSYYPMGVYWVRSATENLFVAIIETWTQHGFNTYGVQTVDLTTSPPSLGTGFLLTNVSYIANIQPIGNAGVFAMDCYDDDYLGQLIAFDTKLGRPLWSASRRNSYGYVIVPVPGTNYFVSNMDTRIFGHANVNDPTASGMNVAIVDARTGNILGQCDFAFDQFALVPNTKNAQNPIVVGSIYGDDALWEKYVRAVQFEFDSTAGTYSCVTLWQFNAGTNVRGISPAEFAYTVGNNQYIEIVTDDGYTYSVSPQAGPLPTPAPTLPAAPAPWYSYMASLSAAWQTPFTIVPTFSPIMFGDYAKIGNPAFAAVDAGYGRRSNSNDNKEQSDAVLPRYTALIAYQAGAAPAVNPGEEHYLFDSRTLVNVPVPLFDNFGFRGEKEPTVAAVAFTTRSGEGFLLAMAYPGTGLMYRVARNGAFAVPAANSNGRVFFSIGAMNNQESFVCYLMSGDGTSFIQQWSFPLTPADNTNVPNGTSHVGNANFVFVPNANGYVTFSFFGTLYTLDAVTGAQMSATLNPCGYVSPDDADNNFAPTPMFESFVDLTANNTPVQVALVNRGPGVDSGNWGICGLTADGRSALWKVDLTAIDSFNGFVPIFFSNYVLYSGVSIQSGGGILIGVDASNGNSWMVTRQTAVNTMPAPLPLGNNDNKYFVANMDQAAFGSASSSKVSQVQGPYLSVVEFKSGQVAGQCAYACNINPIRIFVIKADNTIEHYFVCTLVGYPNVLRATQFIPTNNDQTSVFTCATYWDIELPSPAQAVWLNGHTYISVALEGGAVLTLGMESGPDRRGGNNNNNNNNNGDGGHPGMSGGAAAALAICLLILAAFVGGAIYYTRFRNVRRSAISEAQHGLEYNSGTAAAGASATAGSVQGQYGSTQDV